MSSSSRADDATPLPSTALDTDEEEGGDYGEQWDCTILHDMDATPTSTLTPTSTSTPTTITLGGSEMLDGSGHNATIVAAHKSAFLPYRPQATVLTNLQRGNTEATFCPTEVVLPFHERAGQGEITAEQLQQEMKRLQSADVDFRDADDFTALHWAAFYGQQATVELLLDAGASANVQALELVTPLILAAASGHHEVVRILLEHNARPNHMDITGSTALMYAAHANHPRTCHELLAKGADILVCNEDGDSAYLLAINYGADLALAVIEQHIHTMFAE